MNRRRKNGYFERIPGAPEPLVACVRRRISFGEVDAMAVAWHGGYAAYFEEAATEARRLCGLTYEEFFKADLHAPLVQFHVDFRLSLRLDEWITTRAALIWTDAARLNTEYEIRNAAGEVAAVGYTVQLFIRGPAGQTCYTLPPLVELCRQRWKEGAFERPS